MSGNPDTACAIISLYKTRKGACMKRITAVMTCIALLVVVLAVPVSAGASEEVVVDGCVYLISDNTATLIDGKDAQGDLEIPSYVGDDNARVLNIGEGAF